LSQQIEGEKMNFRKKIRITGTTLFTNSNLLEDPTKKKTFWRNKEFISQLQIQKSPNNHKLFSPKKKSQANYWIQPKKKK